ncbi:hypothetical protein [Phyllobacterium sp. YR531]|uniref:hypothetical protein n=1 Tax=Phyllobacterium sp. YR531 TaxID=1144343 RepID=UPI00026F8F86|nr:hypothetical protein [Phyllobacterium sp. YR531]EJN06079.1 hypothetical protein PMI41_00474 [Phyllobacterium sp. YR531]
MTLFVAFGLPGTMFSWGTTALSAIAHEVFGDCNTVKVETLAELQEAWRNRTSEAMIITSHYPDKELCDFLMRSRAPYLVFTEDVMDSMNWLSQTTGTTDIPLVRAMSASIACISQIRSHPLIVAVQRQKMGPVQIHRILGHFCRTLGINLSKDGIVRCLEKLGADFSGPAPDLSRIPTFEVSAKKLDANYMPPGAEYEAISPDIRAIALDVLKPLDGSIMRTPIKQMIWPLQTFLLADKEGASIVSEIELVGRARCVVYGPYFHLPPGEWTARFSLRIDTEIYGQIFTIEIHNSELLSRIRIRPSQTGSFIAEAQFLVERAKEPIEIRLFTESGSIEGSIAHWSVELIPEEQPKRENRPERPSILPKNDQEFTTTDAVESKEETSASAP